MAPQSPCICLQQACSALLIELAGTAHIMDGASTDKTRRTVHNARLNRCIFIQSSRTSTKKVPANMRNWSSARTYRKRHLRHHLDVRFIDCAVLAAHSGPVDCRLRGRSQGSYRLQRAFSCISAGDSDWPRIILFCFSDYGRSADRVSCRSRGRCPSHGPYRTTVVWRDHWGIVVILGWR